MFFLPAINLRRTFLIARRDYLGYVKTVGFWVSFLLPFLGAGLGFAFTQLDVEFSPPRYEAILDETGNYEAGILSLYEERDRQKLETVLNGMEGTLLSQAQVSQLNKTLESQGASETISELETLFPSSGSQLSLLDKKVIFVPSPAKTLEEMQPYLKGEKRIMVEGKEQPFAGLLHIRKQDDKTIIDYWSKNITANDTKRLANDYFQRRSVDAFLEKGGLDRIGLDKAAKGAVKIESFNPTKAETESQAVNKEDRIPYIVAAVLAGFLWLTVFSGSYMLLTSMLEEKLNKLLEMMLASTRFSEIIFGKLIGVAALTLTAMAPYLLLGIGGIAAIVFFQDSEMTRALANSFTPKIIIFFLIFLILGYIFYGACFIAMGALSQSMQDAQTITTPIVIILTLCVLVVPFGLENPDSPLLRLASLFPLSSPFAVIVRLPSDPPLWELIISAVILALCSIVVIWAAGRIFRYGVLSGSGIGAIKGWFNRVILRKKA